MKKKLNAKERRMLEKERINQKIAENNQKKSQKQEEEAENQKLQEEENKKAIFKKKVEALERENADMAKVKKSSAKSAGLKSTFVLDDNTILMTSFGNGNKAIAEKYVKNDIITNASEHPSLNVCLNDKKFNITGRMTKDGITDNPLKSTKKTGQDQIYCREKLEQMCFGKTFTDNIHIQVSYCILDIEKILAVHVNNIVYELNNLLRQEDNNTDLFSRIGIEKTYEEFSDPNNTLKKLLGCPQLGYFGNTLLPLYENGERIEREDGFDVWNDYYNKCYYLLSVLGTFRHATAHGDEKNRTRIYQLDDYYVEGTTNEEVRKYRKAVKRELDCLYEKKVTQTNKGFLSNSQKDLKILSSVLNINTSEYNQLVQDYYRFIVLKEYKYLGFSIKKIREVMIEQNASQIKEQEYNSVRRKLNHLLDFTIYKNYQSEKGKIQASKLVDRLRSVTKDSEKEIVYRNEANLVWSEIATAVENKLLPKMDGAYIASIKGEMQELECIKDIAIKENATLFCEAIYLLTIFLDGKEINDLLTQLINKFDNICSLLNVIKSQGIEAEFLDNYRIFRNSEKIVSELKSINSFARMSETSAKAKEIMFIEAAKVLGYSGDEDTLKGEIKALLDKEGGKRLPNGKKDNGFRNFIINNVIESDRFKYLVRYGNPDKIRNLAENKNVIGFVLKEIPDEQIRSYYNSCSGESKTYRPEMRRELANWITGLQFKNFENVNQKSNNDPDKERKKSLVRLYLTVLYLLQKNLVYINSRYFLAFHAAERDAMIYDSSIKRKDITDNWSLFASKFISDHPRKKKKQDNLENNLKCSDPWVLHNFRNCTEHLNAVRNIDKYINDIAYVNSYFELYHYIVQRSIMDEYEAKKPGQLHGKTEVYFASVNKYHTYCKDFVKAMNVPFAYNSARYENLSVNELFDCNNYLPKKAKNWMEDN